MRTAFHNDIALAAWPDGEYASGVWLDEQSRARAALLRAAGVSAGDRIAIAHGNSAGFFADLFAVWRVGACAVCLNPGLTPGELENVCSFAEPRTLLGSDGSQLPDVPGLTALCLGDAVGTGKADGADNDPDPSGCLDDDALMLFTSGTTGEPKGVVHSYRSLLARTALNAGHIGRDAMARTLCVLPTHFGHGLIGNCLTPLLSGQSVLLAPAGNLDVIANLGSIIDEHRITFMSSVPSFWRKVLKSAPAPAGGTLQRVHVGSAPLPAGLWRDVADWCGTRAVYNMYGITETANWLAGAPLPEGGNGGEGYVGPMWGGNAAILAEDGGIAFEGEGEVLVQTPSLMKGYFRRPDLTDAVLRDGWYRTGDVGELDSRGHLRLIGRRKYEINRGGLKVHPEDIDMVLERHQDVREACAFSMPHEVEGETVAAAVALTPGSTLSITDLRKWCARHLVREKLPERWFIVPEIPKTDRGKVSRDAVARACLQEPVS